MLEVPKQSIFGNWLSPSTVGSRDSAQAVGLAWQMLLFAEPLDGPI